MISIVSVFNDKKILDKHLIHSLKKQHQAYDLVTVDNRKKNFRSAAEALNCGFKKTNKKSRYIFFAHQDIAFMMTEDLRRIEKELDAIPHLGVAGFAGMDFANNRTGYILHFSRPWGKKIANRREVFTLDELGLIVPRKIFSKHQFDQRVFDGWHCYGADYCLWAHKHRLKVVVLPVSVHHNTGHQALSNRSLFLYQEKLLNKYPACRRIYTTNGTVSNLTILLRKFPINDKVIFYYKEKLFGKLKFLKKFRFSNPPDA